MYGHFEPIIDILHSNLSSIHPSWKHDHENNKSSLHEDIKTCSNVLKKRKIQHDSQTLNVFEIKFVTSFPNNESFIWIQFSNSNVGTNMCKLKISIYI